MSQVSFVGDHAPEGSGSGRLVGGIVGTRPVHNRGGMMRGYVERMEWLQRFQDKPVTFEQVIESLMETDDDD